VLGLELYTAAQALDLRRDMINAARALARSRPSDELAGKIACAPGQDAPAREAFMAEVEGLRAELAAAEEFRPGHAVRAAHAVIRESIPFMGFDRAMDGDVRAAVALVRDGRVLAAARQAVQGDDARA